MDRQLLQLWLVSFALLCGVQSVHAVDYSADPNALFEMSLQDLMNLTVFSASRQEQTLSNATVPISIISAEDIHYSGLTTIPDVLRFCAGIDVHTSDRIYSAVGVHGLHDKISDRTLILINGRTADSPLYGGSQFYSYPVLMEDIERIEVIRGPGGAAWGANAFQGVINIITKKPKDLKGLFAGTTVTEFGDTFSHLRWADTVKDWNWKASLGYEGMKDSETAGAGGAVSFSRPEFAPFIDTTTNYSTRDFSRKSVLDMEGSYEISEASRLSLGLAYSHKETGNYEFLGNNPMKNGWFDAVRAFTKIDHTFDDGSFAYVQWTGNFNDSYQPSIGKWKEAENDIEVQYNFNPSDRHAISVGGNFRWTHITPETFDATYLIFTEDHYNEYLAGLFLIDRWTVNDAWTLEGQIREDWYSPTGEELSTRLTALYTMDKETEQILRFSIARAFRAPRVDLREAADAGASLAPMGFPNFYAVNLLKADSLSNEQMWAFETGYHQKLTPKTVLRADGYYHILKDLIGYKEDIPDPLPLGRTFLQAQNISDAAAFGVDVQIEHRQGNQSLTAWYSFNDLQTWHDEHTENLRAYAPSKNKTGLTWRIFLEDDWTINTNYRYQDSTHELGPVKDAKLHHRLDLTVSRRFANGSGEFMVGVTDLFNETAPPAYMVGQFTAFETPGRTFFTRLQMNF